MRLLSYAFIIGFLTFSYGCRKNNILDLGTINLEEDSKEIIPYEGGEVLMFRDSVGDALRLVGEMIREYTYGSQSSSCAGGGLFGSNCETVSYTTNSYEIYFNGSKRSEPSQRINFQLRLSVNYQDSGFDTEEEPKFFDEFRIRFIGENFFRISYLVNDKGNNNLSIADFYNSFREESEVTILGERFENVIVFLNNNEEEQLYYSKENGIVGFVEENETLWVLDN